MSDDSSIPNDEPDDQEMPWESAARGRVRDALEDIRFDELRGVVYLMSGEDHRINAVEEEFSSYEGMVQRLSEIYDEEWYGNVQFDGGEAVFSSDAEGEVGDMLADENVEDFFGRMRSTEEGEELADAKKLIVPAGGLIVGADLAEINDELVKHLARHPELMHKMDPHKFEELVAALLRAKGYEVEATKRTRDGGVDIRAFRACLKTTRGAAARDFGRRQDGEVGASPHRAATTKPTLATDKRSAARRVFGEKAVWRRCSSVKDPPGVFSFVESEQRRSARLRGLPCHTAFSPKTAPLVVFKQALRKSDVGTLLTLTQCKRYAPDKKVTVEAVRQLYGVVESDRATNGLIVTTSAFTRDAKTYQEKIKFRMSLADMDVLKQWLAGLQIRPTL
jgi:hypothetical protein